MLGGHSETIQIDFDPERISYEELLDIFWNSHDPTQTSWSQQYKKAVFYHDEKQRMLAEKSKKRLEADIGSRIKTSILPYKAFYLAEDYHQKHVLRGHPRLIEEFENTYPNIDALVFSTAAARVNGYLGGNSTCDRLKSEIDGLGLSEAGRKELAGQVCGGNIELFCPTKTCL